MANWVAAGRAKARHGIHGPLTVQSMTTLVSPLMQVQMRWSPPTSSYPLAPLQAALGVDNCSSKGTHAQPSVATRKDGRERRGSRCTRFPSPRLANLALGRGFAASANEIIPPRVPVLCPPMPTCYYYLSFLNLSLSRSLLYALSSQL